MPLSSSTTFADGTFPLPSEAQWSTIINSPSNELNVNLDKALRQISTDVPALRGCFVEGTFTTRNLAPNDIKKVQIKVDINTLTLRLLIIRQPFVISIKPQK